MKKTLLITIGFILFLMGSIALILSLVGLNLTFLSPLESLGAGVAFLIKIMMILVGLIMAYASSTTSE